MKHVFFAHSHTLLLCSLGTIEYLRLDSKDCVLLCTRNYNIPDGLMLTKSKIIDANKAYDQYESYRYGSFRTNRRAIALLDEYIKDWTDGDEFMFYPPHLWGGIFSFVASHPKCKKVSFVQEGAYTVSGYFQNKVSLYKKIKGYIKSIRHFGNLRAYPCGAWYVDGCLGFQKRIDVYSTSPLFFQYMPKEKTDIHIIKWSQCQDKLVIEHLDAPIFIFDGYITNKIVDKEVYLRNCERLILENANKQNYVKFHPAQTEYERKYIINVFDKIGRNVEVFTETKPFEFYISKYQNLTIVGFGSSLMYFARDAGHRVIARSSWLLESDMFKRQVEIGYPVFDNN